MQEIAATIDWIETLPAQRYSSFDATMKIFQHKCTRTLLFLFLFTLVIGKQHVPSEKGKRSLLQRLQFWKGDTAEPEEDANKIPEWSAFANQKPPESDFGVDDYSTGRTSSMTADGSYSKRPPMPKDPPPKIPDEVVLDDSESVQSDITMESNDGEEEEDDFADAQEDEEFEDASQEL